MGFIMKLEARQFLQQRQELQLSLFQTQALQILQMPTFELERYIQQEAETNPFIELNYTSPEDTENAVEQEDDEKSLVETINKNISDSNQDADSYDVEGNEVEVEDREESVDDYRNEHFTDLSRNPDIDEWIEDNFSNIKYRETLRSYLINQLHIEIEGPKEIEIGESIVASIDHRGYFVGNLDEIAKEFNTTPERVEQILKKIQSFDPPGIGARDSKECLLIQVERLYPDNILLRKLIEEYSEELVRRQIPKIAKGLGIKPHEVEELIKLLKTLNPYPGYLFEAEPEYIVPDVIVRITEEDKLSIELVNNHLPEIIIVEPVPKNQSKHLPKEEKAQIRKFKESAIRLKKCVDLRNSTLFKVAKEIILMQEEFIRKGTEHLRPLTYKDIAERLQIHESTISRCIAGKYMQTPQGLFEFRYFFSGALKSEKGEKELSSRTVKEIIKNILDEEDKSKPLSDQQIAELIQKQEGIKIARRTISKYREEMNIPNAFERKVYSK